MTSPTSAPLVSIGLPTYNRAAKLEKATEFILAQDYSNIELVISDNASTDRTPEVCEALQRRDGRVRYIRQATNVGPTANYRAVLEGATGEMYMAIADDDWLEPNYVSSCLAALRADPELLLVCGQSMLYRDGKLKKPGSITRLLDDDATDRVVRYYQTVWENGAFHGIVRREAILGLPRMMNTMAGDWMWMASFAFTGKIETLTTTHVIKHLGGASASYANIVRVLQLPAWQGRYWTEAILSSVMRDIWRSPVYEPLGAVGRARLAARVAMALAVKWKIWHQWRRYAQDAIRQLVADQRSK